MGNMLVGKPKIPGWGVTRAVERLVLAGDGVIRIAEGAIRAGQDI